MNIDNHIRLFEAMEFANWAHRNQMRHVTKAPYIIHPLHVITLLMAHEIDADDPEDLDVLIAAANHDTLEDNPAEVTIDLLENKIGKEPTRIVCGVTLDPVQPDKRASRRKIAAADWKIQIVKVADVLSNTVHTITSIHERGLDNTQTFFSQPIKDRVHMEWEFLQAISQETAPEELLHLMNSCDEALGRLSVLAITS